MPQVTIGAGETYTLPANVINSTDSRRTMLLYVVAGGDCAIGWTPTVSETGATDAAVPLPVAQTIGVAADDARLNRRVKFFSVAGCTLRYQFQTNVELIPLT